MITNQCHDSINYIIMNHHYCNVITEVWHSPRILFCWLSFWGILIIEPLSIQQRAREIMNSLKKLPGPAISARPSLDCLSNRLHFTWEWLLWEQVTCLKFKQLMTASTRSTSLTKTGLECLRRGRSSLALPLLPTIRYQYLPVPHIKIFSMKELYL